MTSMRIPSVGPKLPPNMATRVCARCVASGVRDLKPMMIHFQRDVTEDFGTVIYTCRLCPHQDIGAQVELDVLSRLSGHIFSAA